MELVRLVLKTETCRSCARPMPESTVLVTLENRAWTLRATVCRVCADAAASQTSSARCKSEWQRLCPPHYQRDLPTGILAQSWVGDVLGWQYKPQGLLVIGDTGSGKTWVMWRLLRRLLKDVSGHYKPASNGRNDPATKICVSRHFSSKQARTNSLMSGLFERKMPLFS
jgi:hypothetical protein